LHRAPPSFPTRRSSDLEASGAELDPPVPAGDHHHSLVQSLPIDGRQDRPPRGAGGLAVVTGAVQPPDPPGPAVVGGVGGRDPREDRKSTRLNSSHVKIS